MPVIMMAGKPKRPCAEPGCNELTRNTYCKSHLENAQKIAQENSYKKRDKKSQSLYNSYEWQKLRQLAMKRDNYLCQSCLREGVLASADVVHHLVEVRDDWSKRLDLDNLESVCHGCHNVEHKAYPRG